MRISSIKIEKRHRTDMGDIDALAKSIATVGLLHPIVIDAGNFLIAGERRIEACKKLGWKEVEVRVATGIGDIAKALQAERDENTCRKDFTPTEAATMAESLEGYEKKAAKDRQGQRADKHPVNFTGSSNGAAADKVAEAVGMSRPTLEKAKAVVAAAKAHPDHYGDIQKEMDDTGKVSPAYKKLAERQAEPERPKVKLPHRIDPEPFTDDTDLPPVPDGPTPEEIVRANPFITLGKVLQQVWGGINAFHYKGTLKKLKAGTSAERKRMVKRIEGLLDELNKLKVELE